MPETTFTPDYGATGAPSGGRGPCYCRRRWCGWKGIRGFVVAYRRCGDWKGSLEILDGSEAGRTWFRRHGKAMPFTSGGGSTWVTGSYHPDMRLLSGSGNPFPDTDGDDRKGDNLYTNCVVALDAKTGKLRWHYQFTPHDLHDWDATEPLVLIDTEFRGHYRKLLLQANRNGFFYVLDRTTGELLLAEPLVKKLTWASGIGKDGRPVLLEGNQPTTSGTRTCPAVRGATNWYSTAFNPSTSCFMSWQLRTATSISGRSWGATFRTMIRRIRL